MPPRPRRPDALAGQVFRGTDAVRDGLLTPCQLRGASWLRLGHDVYADARLDRDHALCCRAVALRMPAGAVIAGPSAAYLHGVEHAATFRDAVHVLVRPPVRMAARRGVQVHQTRFAPDPPTPTPVPDPTARGALPPGTARRGPYGPCDTAGPALSDPTSAAWETAVWWDLVRAVGIVDTLLALGPTTRNALADLGARRADRPGGQRALQVFDLADPGAQSPPESHLRVRLVLAGLPRPVSQHPVRLPSGRFLHPDLAWPEFRVAIEYDGVWHADAGQSHRDRCRLNQLVAAGWLVLHVTARRLRHELPALLREIRAALTTRGWRR